LVTLLFQLIGELLWLYRWVVILAVVFSLLTSFGVVDTRNRIVWSIGDFLYRVTEPALRPIRRFVPNFGNIDISPVILLLILWVLEGVLGRIYRALIFGDLRGLLF
jgi:YggT family protein